MRRSNFALRVQQSLLDEARKVAEAEGVALNQFINVALAEKLSALRTESYFMERAARANIPRALEILKRAGVGNPPTPGDELPERYGNVWDAIEDDPAEAERMKIASATRMLMRELFDNMDAKLDKALEILSRINGRVSR